MKSDPAFPHIGHTAMPDSKEVYFPGLSKRDLVAAIVMNGILSGNTGASLEHAYGCKIKLSSDCVELADALISELAK